MADTRQPRRSARSSDDPAIIDLLNDVRSARLTLSADLSATAGALEAGQLEVARDILAADQRELAEFAAAAKQRLGSAGADPGPAAVAVPDPRRPRRTRTRLLLALPAIPLVGAVAMTAAAAIGGSAHGHSAANHRAVVTQHRIVTSSSDHLVLPVSAPTADSTLNRLEHVVSHHPKAAQVLAVANDLHQQLTQMIATSRNNPQQLGVVRQLLTLEQRVLEGNNAPGSTVALAASREIAQLLSRLPASAQPTTTAAPNKSVTPAPKRTAPTSATPTKTPPVMPSAPTTKHHPHATPTASHKAKKTPKPFDPLHFPNVFRIDG